MSNAPRTVSAADVWPVPFAAGLILAVTGLAADFIGLSAPGRFGLGQAAMLLGGLSLAALGILMRLSRAPAFRRFLTSTATAYRWIAMTLLTTIVMAGVLELSSWLVFRLTRPAQTARMEEALAGHDWGATHLRELGEVALREAPYVVWRAKPFAGTTLEIGDDGIRETPGAVCTAESFRILTFGGSALWGFGSDDAGTIPSQLQQLYEVPDGRPLCVENHGELGYGATQGLIRLSLLLRSGVVPDLVIFYDGVNDTYSAYQSGVAGSPQQFQGGLPGGGNALTRLFRKSSTLALAQDILVHKLGKVERTYESLGVPRDELADNVVAEYLAVYEMVQGLAAHHGFAAHFFWQPVLTETAMVLSPGEEEKRAAMPKALRDLLHDTYRRLGKVAPTKERLHDLSGVFDDMTGPIWVDWWHVNPAANRRVAAAMLQAIADGTP